VWIATRPALAIALRPLIQASVTEVNAHAPRPS
jgi:hypothetical protein